VVLATQILSLISVTNSYLRSYHHHNHRHETCLLPA
jgi:hypothetical protein